jgi:hypothetical protein
MHTRSLLHRRLSLAPGEYYVDTASNTLYFYPPSPISGADVFVSVGQSVISLTSVSYVTLDGFTASFARDTGVNANNVDVRSALKTSCSY